MQQKPSESQPNWVDRVARVVVLVILSLFSFLIKLMMGTFLIAIELIKKVVREKPGESPSQHDPH
jgi:hypothetical protein